MKRKKSTALFLFAILVIVLYGMHPLLLGAVARFLTYQTPLHHADLIVVLGGGYKDRVKQGVKLYRQGLSARLLFTGGIPFDLPGVDVSWGDLAKKEAIRMGVPAQAVLVEPRSTSTYEDAIYTRQWMKRYHWTSLIVVSDPLHLKRASWTFKKVFEKTPVQLYFCPVEHGWFKMKKWWTREQELVMVFTEYIKITLYFFKYFIRDSTNT